MTKLIFKDDIDQSKIDVLLSLIKSWNIDATVTYDDTPSHNKPVNTDVDMTYRLTRDDEPTDEQLAVIMQEVGEKARWENEELTRKLHEKLKYEYQKAKERYAQL
jgi:hypothetical protein